MTKPRPLYTDAQRALRHKIYGAALVADSNAKKAATSKKRPRLADKVGDVVQQTSTNT